MKPQRVLEQGEKKTRQKFRSFFLVPWENAESSFEDSVVKKKNNEQYQLYAVKLHTKW